MAQIGEVPGGGRPFGDIYTVNTPALDRFGQQMYAQEIQRQNQMRQDAKALDEEFSRNAANIRDADLPEYSKAYQDYKTAYLQSLKSKKEYSPEQQMELLRKRANVYSVIKNSKDTDAVLRDYAKKVTSDTKGLYNPDAPSVLRGYNSVPSKQITDKYFDDLMWKFGNTDFSKEEAAAKGHPRTAGEVLVGVDPNDPNSDLISNYQVGNNFLEHFNSLGQSITGSKKTEDYQRLINNQYTPEELQQLTEAFNKKVNDPLYKKLYGVDGATTFPSWAYNTPIGNALRIATMKDVVDTPISPVTKSVPNKTRMMLTKDAIGDENAATKFNRSKILKSIGGSGSGYSSNGSNQQFNNVYGDIDEAVNAGNGMAKVSDLNIVGAGIISDVLRKRTSNPNEAANIINDGAYIKRGADGILRFHSKDDRISFPVTYKDINTIANTTAKGDNAVLNTTPKPEKPGKKKTIAELMREAASKPK